MSTSTPPPSDTPSASYTMLDSADVEAIGAHCQYAYCNQLDFLPFKCGSCAGKFCLDHRTETAHACTNPGAWARNRTHINNPSTLPPTQRPTVLNSTQCSDPSCKTLIDTSTLAASHDNIAPRNVGIHCATCNRDYCLKHRMQEDHNCKNLAPIGARPATVTLQQNREKLQAGFTKLKLWGAKQKADLAPKPKPTSKAAQLAALHKIKQTSTGDNSIPQEKRLYLHCLSPEGSKEKNMFFNKEMKVGQVLDKVVKAIGVDDSFVKSEKEGQLVLCKMEGGFVLENSEKIGLRMTNGETLLVVRDPQRER